MSPSSQIKRPVSIAVVIVILAGILVVVFWNLGDSEEVPPVAGSASPVIEVAPPVPEGVEFLADAPFALEFGKEETSAQRELELVQLAFADYLQFVKPRYQRPFGNNADLVSLLSGNNPYGIAAILPGHSRIDEEGRLTDRWGVAIDVHPLSATAIELRSAGPDRILWTADDLLSTTVSGRDILDRMVDRNGDEKTTVPTR